MGSQIQVKSVAEAMSAVVKWREEGGARHQRDLEQIDEEVRRNKEAILNLKAQIESLGKHKQATAAAHLADMDGEVERYYQEIFASLVAQSRALADRSSRVYEAEKRRFDSINEALSDPEVKGWVEEYQGFKKTVEPTLAALPESYRTLIINHHEGVSAKLRERVASADPGPVEVKEDELAIDIVFSVDAPEKDAELLMLMVPVTEEVHLGWRDRPEDLETQIAARAVQALYQTCASQGFSSAQAVLGGHQGMLAVEVELPEGSNEIAYREALQEALDRVLEDAPEIRAGRIRVRAVYALFDHLLPPDDEMPATEVSRA